MQKQRSARQVSVSRNEGIIMRTVRRINAVLTEYNDPEGCVPQNLKNKYSASMVGITFIALVFAFNTYKLIQYKQLEDQVNFKRYLKYSRIIYMGFVGSAAILAYNCMQIAKSIPQDRLIQIQNQKDRALRLKYNNQNTNNTDR